MLAALGLRWLTQRLGARDTMSQLFFRFLTTFTSWFFSHQGRAPLKSGYRVLSTMSPVLASMRPPGMVPFGGGWLMGTGK